MSTDWNAPQLFVQRVGQNRLDSEVVILRRSPSNQIEPNEGVDAGRSDWASLEITIETVPAGFSHAHIDFGDRIRLEEDGVTTECNMLVREHASQVWRLLRDASEDELAEAKLQMVE